MAIILGGAAGVGFLVICLLFARGLMKKRDGMQFQNTIKFDLFFLINILAKNSESKF